MINRRKFISILVAATLTATPAVADVKDLVISQLKAQGFRKIRIGRTLLGRTRIVAINSRMRREIIINPRTGEILRDYWEVLAPGPTEGGQILNSGNGGPGNSGNGGSDDEGNGGSEDGGSGDDGGNGHDGGGGDGNGGGDGEGGDGDNGGGEGGEGDGGNDGEGGGEDGGGDDDG